MKTSIELKQEQELVRREIDRLRQSAVSQDDLVQLRKLRKRDEDLEDLVVIAQNRERQERANTVADRIKELHSQSWDAYDKAQSIAEELLPLLEKALPLEQELVRQQTIFVNRAEEAKEMATQLELQYGQMLKLRCPVLPLDAMGVSIPQLRNFLELKQSKQEETSGT